MRTVGDRLRALRAAAGDPSQEAVAHAAGVSTRSYSYWELNRKRPTHTNASKLADYFGSSPEWILFGAEATQDERLDRMDKKLDEILRLLKRR